jgi:polyisoprenoid-binding protein YceI
MSLRIVTLVALVLAAGGDAAASPTSRDPLKAPKGDYVLDKAHASLVARVSHMGFSHYTVRFDKISGQFAYDPAAWSTTRAVITIDPASVSTGDPSFDRQIASQFFDAAKYPQITFVSSAIDAHDGVGRIDGDLTFHGVTKPVSLDVAFNGVGPGMLGVGVRLGFSGTAHIKRSDFGVTAVSPLVGDDVDLVIEAEFTRK